MQFRGRKHLQNTNSDFPSLTWNFYYKVNNVQHKSHQTGLYIWVTKYKSSTNIENSKESWQKYFANYFSGKLKIGTKSLLHESQGQEKQT